VLEIWESRVDRIESLLGPAGIKVELVVFGDGIVDERAVRSRRSGASHGRFGRPVEEGERRKLDESRSKAEVVEDETVEKDDDGRRTLGVRGKMGREARLSKTRLSMNKLGS
jgi:hypothetical protein